MTLHKGILRQSSGIKCCHYVHNESLGVKFSLYAQRYDRRKIFPSGIKVILAILHQSIYDRYAGTLALIRQNQVKSIALCFTLGHATYL